MLQLKRAKIAIFCVDANEKSRNFQQVLFASTGNVEIHVFDILRLVNIDENVKMCKTAM